MGGVLPSGDGCSGCPTKICAKSGVSGSVDAEKGSSFASGKKDFSDDDVVRLGECIGLFEYLISCVRTCPSGSMTSGDDSLGLMLSFSLGSGEYLLKPVSCCDPVSWFCISFRIVLW